MKAKLLFLALASLATANAAPPEAFWRALHHVETSGRLGPIPGDYVNGKPQALGPLQIHRAYWQDSGVPGRYSDCADLAYSRRVVTAYLRRYARAAWDRGDWRVLCRVHNGGLTGHKKPSTIVYLRKFEREMKRQTR